MWHVDRTRPGSGMSLWERRMCRETSGGSVVGRHSLRLGLFAIVLTAGCNDNGLRGLGPDIAASPNALGFTAASFTGGAPSASMTVIISNEGGGALKISDISIQ